MTRLMCTTCPSEVDMVTGLFDCPTEEDRCNNELACIPAMIAKPGRRVKVYKHNFDHGMHGYSDSRRALSFHMSDL